jgi:hypothetical protein
VDAGVVVVGGGGAGVWVVGAGAGGGVVVVGGVVAVGVVDAGASPLVAAVGSWVVSVVTSVTWTLGGSTGLAGVWVGVLETGVEAGTVVTGTALTGAVAGGVLMAGWAAARCGRTLCAVAAPELEAIERCRETPELIGWACSRTTTGSLE